MNKFYCWIILGILIIGSYYGRAQRHDANWVMGSFFNPPGTVMHFDEVGNLVYDSVHIPFTYTFTRACYSNKKGELMLYTNGCDIANDRGEYLININQVESAQFWCGENGMYVLDGVLFFPDSKNDSIITTLHFAIDFPENGPDFYTPFAIRQTTVKINDDFLNPIDTIVFNKTIIEGDLAQGYMSAVKHGNGKDWWIFAPYKKSNSFISIHLSDDKILNTFDQSTGPIFKDDVWLGNSAISPDGLHYVRGYGTGVAYLYKIDRCTGQLHYLDSLIGPFHQDSIGRFGISFSPNSRFVYIASPYYVLQIDLNNSDRNSRVQTVATFDGFTDPFSTFFSFMELAPDNKIYIASGNHSKYMHVIEEPDLLGPACNVAQHSLELLNRNEFGVPNFPGYRLGPLKGSPCDTLTPTSEPTPAELISFSVYPNPLYNMVTIESSEENLEFKIIIYDLMGRIIRKQTINEYTSKFSLDLSTLSPGMYPYVLSSLDGRILGSGKLVKIN